MATLFISDLHLCASRPKTTAVFLKFLESDAQNADALYILGDFFEAFIGMDIADQHDLGILQALKQLSQKIPIYFMPGNRDFLFNQSLARSYGCTYLIDPTIIQLYDQSVLLMHGDSLCTLDRSYQYYRRFVQHPLIQKVFLSLPKIIRRKIANGLRTKTFSREKAFNSTINPNTAPLKLAYWDVTEESVQQACRDHKTHILIHGHTHKPAIHDFMLDNTPHKRVVLGDWGDIGSVLVYTPDTLSLQAVC